MVSQVSIPYQGTRVCLYARQFTLNYLSTPNGETSILRPYIMYLTTELILGQLQGNHLCWELQWNYDGTTMEL